MKHLQDLDVLVLGLGASGLAMARWCARHGARVRVWDSREQPPQLAALREQLPGAAFEREAALGSARLVLKSPGLAPRDALVAPLLDAARAAGIAVQGELDLFARALADLKAQHGYAPQVLAITGTNGKTTTTALTALLVERCGRRVASAGNIGPTMLDTLAAALDAETWPHDEAPDETNDKTRDEAQALAQDGAHDVPSDEAQDLAQVRDAGLERDGAAAAGQGAQADLAAADATPPEGRADDAAARTEAAPVVLAPPPPPPRFSHLPEVWVLELSSFQLDGVRDFEPSAAAVLNLTQDHLDWHGSMDAYAGAKARVFGTQAVMVVNRNDEWVERMVPAPVPVKAPGRGRARLSARKVVRFGLDAPTRPGDFGLVVEGGMAWLVRALEADETLERGRRGAVREEEPLHLQRLMPADALPLRGRHNAANALAALALATAIGCALAPMLHGLREYRGEPHRVALVGSLGGVEAFDDSKGTNVGATVAALNGLGADKAPARLVVILGGDGKGQDFTPLAEPLRRHARAVATIGRDAAAVEAAVAPALAQGGVVLQRHDSLEAATAWCFEQAQTGDAVLLSPACASLDMFRNYGHRAEVFVAAVHALAAERGQAL